MTESVLVGDIGGTNVRFGCARLGFAGHIDIEHVAVMPGDDFCSFDAALKHYLKQLGDDHPRRALFAFAGTIDEGTVELTNRDWVVNDKQIAKTSNLDHVHLVNDYAAMARSIPELSEPSFCVLHEGQVPEDRFPILVAGPGTGLGMATLVPEGERGWRVITGQGGHARFAPRSDLEWTLTKRLQATHGYVSKELVLSGSGFNAVHRAMCEIYGVEWIKTPPAEIMQRAEAGDPLSRDICELRASATLDALGDAALTNGTRGGVVITGGVAERLRHWLTRPQSLERFFERGPMSYYMKPLPIRLLLEGHAALIGAAALHFDAEITA